MAVLLPVRRQRHSWRMNGESRVGSVATFGSPALGTAPSKEDLGGSEWELWAWCMGGQRVACMQVKQCGMEPGCFATWSDRCWPPAPAHSAGHLTGASAPAAPTRKHVALVCADDHSHGLQVHHQRLWPDEHRGGEGDGHLQQGRKAGWARIVCRSMQLAGQGPFEQPCQSQGDTRTTPFQAACPPFPGASRSAPTVGSSCSRSR